MNLTVDNVLESWRAKAELIVKHNPPKPILDHGHVRLIDVMGDDQAIVQAARVSYGLGHSEHKVALGGEDWMQEWTEDHPGLTCEVCGLDSTEVKSLTHCPEGDRKLIRYLSRVRHTSPLEQCEIKLHMKMPIFVARQLVRHRTANLNEVSGRYSVLPAEFYVPELGRIQKQSRDNKQGSGEPFSDAEASHIQSNIRTMAQDEFKHYSWMNAQDVAKELSRINLPLSTYTEWYWKIDLHNLLHFLALRKDAHAQKEIRDYADVIGDVVADWVPFTWEAFLDYRFRAETFSQQEMELLRSMVSGALYEGGVPRDWHSQPRWRQRVFGMYDIETVRERKAFLKRMGLL
jgi:thymidylate synthase (FAD)